MLAGYVLDLKEMVYTAWNPRKSDELLYKRQEFMDMVFLSGELQISPQPKSYRESLSAENG